MLRRFHVLMDKVGDDGAGGGPPPADDKSKAPDLSKDFEALKTQNAALLARLEKLEGKKSDDDDDLLSKARKSSKEDDKKTSDIKALESSIKFNLGSDEWLKTNSTLLPKGIEAIFKESNKEKFDSEMEKASAIKAGIVQEFFSIQANLDLLTPGLKNQLEDYLKLTKTGKQEKAQQIYESVFEPAFELLKRVKKTEALQKGFSTPTEIEDSYKKRLMQGSKKHYLGEKENA